MVTKEAFGHFGISLIKSILRIIGCSLVVWKPSLSFVSSMACCFLVAELLGILEEVCDKR